MVNSISGVPVTFNVVQIKDGRDVDRVILCNREKVKIRDGSKTKDKAPYSGTRAHVCMHVCACLV